LVGTVIEASVTNIRNLRVDGRRFDNLHYKLDWTIKVLAIDSIHQTWVGTISLPGGGVRKGTPQSAFVKLESELFPMVGGQSQR
jgi:hypothetical protein